MIGLTSANSRIVCLSAPAVRLALYGLLLFATSCQSLHRHRADRLVDRGKTLMVQENLEQALVEFQKAARIDPRLAAPHSQMGKIYQRMGDYEQAIDSFLEAITRNPFSFDDTLSLARLYQFTKRIGDAIQAYLHAVELEPKSFDAQLNLGTCYQQTGDYMQAVEGFQRAIEIDPDRPAAYINLGVALDRQGKYYEAIRAYKEALERDTRQPLVLVNLAHTYMSQDRLKMARQSLEHAIRMDSGLASGHEALGYCLFRSRDFEEAERAYKRALVCDWRLPRAYSGLGSINMLRFMDDKTQLDLQSQALEYWHRSLELDPDQPRIRDLIARYKPRRESPDTSLFKKPRSTQ